MRPPRTAWIVVSAVSAAICYLVHQLLKVEGDVNDLRVMASMYFLFATIAYPIGVAVIGSLRHSKSRLAPFIPAIVACIAIMFPAMIVLAVRLAINMS